MAEYDGSIRIGTGIDTKGFDEDGKELEEKAKKLGKSLSNSVDGNIQVDAENVKKDVEKVFDDLEKEEKRIEELAKRAVERAKAQSEIAITPQAAEDSKLFTPGYNQDAVKFLEDQGKGLEKTDEHWNLLRIDVEEYAKSLKELKDQGKFYSDEDFNQAYIAWKNANDAVKAYRAELDKQTESGKAKIAEQEAKAAERKEAAQRKAEEQAEKALQRVQKQIENETKLQAKEAERQAKIRAEAAEEERLNQIRANAVAENDEIIAKVERIRQLEREITDLKKVEKTEGYTDYNNRIKELSKLKQDVKEYRESLSEVPERFSRMRKSAKKAFDAVSEGTKKSNASLNGGLKTILKYGFGIRSMYVLFSKVRAGIKAGFTNLMGYSDGFANSVQSVKNSMSTLGNQIAASFYPIVQMVIPWLNSLISAITKAMTYVAQFIAVLGGSSTFTRAKKVQDAYNKSLGGTAKAADKARGALAKFDDLDVLEKPDSGAGGGGIEGTLPKDMFEEVPVDMKLPVWLDGIIERLRELKDIFMEGFWDGLGDWEPRWESIKSSAASIKDTLVDIWTDPEVLSAQNEYYNSFAYMLGSITGSAASIGLTIATNLVGGIAKYLEQNKDRIKEFIVSMFDVGADINGLIAEFSQAFSFIFEAFGSEEAQQLTANLIGIFTDAVMGTLEVLGKLARDILNIFIQPFVDNKEEFRTALEGFLSVLSEVTGTIKQGIDDTFDKLNEVYDAHFKPFFDSIANGLSDTVGKFLEFWNENVQPILEEWAETFDIVWAEHIQPMLDNFIELLGKVADFLTVVWENILKPLIDWIIENVLPVILPIIDGIGKAVMTLFALISDVVSGIIDVFGGVIDFLIGVFTGNWKKAWDGVVKIFSGIGNTIKGIINGILGGIEILANGVINAINAIIRALNGLSFDLPDWLPGGLGGKTLGFNIGEIPNVTIPKLATGAVIRGGNPFMAILGDQPAGKTNIETPADLIKDMVKQGIAESGYGQQQSVPVTINLNYDGETFARLSIPDILAELGRQGYDVDVLGVT